MPSFRTIGDHVSVFTPTDNHIYDDAVDTIARPLSSSE